MSTLFQQVLTAFAPILTERGVGKHEQLHAAGSASRQLYLVRSGILRAYYLLDGRDITAHFAVAEECVTAPDSFLLGEGSKYYIEALQDTMAYVVQRNEMESYLLQHPECEKLARRFTESIYIDLLRRSESLIFLSAKQRYDNMLRERPDILELAPLGHIASYLNMTQETLSRVRADR